MRIVVLLNFLLLNLAILGQPLSSFQNVAHLTDELPQHTVQSLQQDKDGFVWIGTESGLCQYNGSSIKTFKTGLKSNYTLKDNKINAIEFDKSGRLWIATAKGLSIFWPDRSTDYNAANTLLANKFNALSKDRVVNCILIIDKHTTLVGCSGGYGLINESSGSINYFATTLIDKKKVTPNIIKIKALPGRKFLMLTQKEGLLLGDFEVGFTSFYSSNAPISDGNIEYFDFVQISPTRYFIATDEGLYIGNSSILKKVSVAFKTNGFNTNLQCNVLLHCQRTNTVLVGTYTQGLVVFDTSGKMLDHVYSTSTNRPLLSNNIFAILSDKNNQGYWIGTGQGLTRFFYKENYFYNFRLADESGGHLLTYPLYTEDNKTLLAGTIAGLFRIDIFTKKQKLIPTPQNTKNRFYSIVKQKEGTLLFGTDNGIFYAGNVNTTNLKRFSDIHAELKFMDRSRIYFIHQTSMGNLLFAYRNDTAVGLANWNPLKKMVTIEHIDKNNRLSAKNVINSIVADNVRRVYIGTNEGLFQYDLTTSNFSTVVAPGVGGLNNAQVNTLYTDKSSLWISTFGGGINRLKLTDKMLSYVTENEGLSNNDTYQIQSSGDSILWISTNRGISSYNKKSGVIVTYDINNGTLDNEFNRNSSFKCGDTIYFGGLRGITSFTATAMQKSDIRPTVLISDIYVVSSTGDSLIYPNANGSLTVSQSQNTLRLLLSCPFYINPSATKYYYRILPDANEWISTGSDKQILLTGLGKGSHQIEVKAITSEGEMSSNIASLLIKVKARWYQTLLFKTAMLLLFSSIGWAIYRLRKKQKEKEKAIREQIAADLHDDLGGTLNSIKLYAQLAHTNHEDNPYLIRVSTASQAAVSGLKDLIWTLDDSKDAIGDLSAKIEKATKDIFESAAIDFTCHTAPIAAEFLLTKEEKRTFYLILKEAITNCVKHSFATTASLTFDIYNKKPLIRFEDNGKGNFLAFNNEGHGLQNMKIRAEKAGYVCRIFSQEQKGTTVEIAIA
ncbi:MAG: hypothetical protein RL115_2470 [Bacteroidota bacterium]